MNKNEEKQQVGHQECSFFSGLLQLNYLKN
jgi:hypothetical protein